MRIGHRTRSLATGFAADLRPRLVRGLGHGARGVLPLMLAALLAPATAAAGLSVSPASLELAAGDPDQTLWVSNDGTTPLQAELQVQRWSQAAGDDLLEPTPDLVVSPAMLRIAPGQRQQVRLLRPQPGPALAAEQSYRIVVETLADPAGPGPALVTQFFLPVFLAPPAAVPPPALSWHLEPRGGRMVLVARNAGGRHAEVTDLELRDAQGRLLLRQPGLLGYALPGSARRWPVGLSAAQYSLLTAVHWQQQDGQARRQTVREP